MSWIELDINELNVETEKSGKGGMLEPGVYECTIGECYLDKTKNGTSFVNFEFITGTFPNDKEIKITGWDVNRMIKKSTGEAKNSKGRYFTGIILLNKIAKCIGKDIGQLTPVTKLVEIWNERKEVFSFNELIGKKIVVGIRHKKYWNQNNEEKVKLDIADICCEKDDKYIEKLKIRIEKKPIVEDTSNKPSNNTPTDTGSIPF